MFTLSEKFGKRSWRLERFYSLMVPYLFEKMKFKKKFFLK